MTTTMTITLMIISAASIALNVFQYMERRIERKEADRRIEDAALLEDKYNKLTVIYENEKLHKEWAIGRIKDQQSVIDRLNAIGTPAKAKKVYKPRKEADND